MRLFLHHRDGHRIPVAVRAAALRSAEGRMAGAVEVFHDDTRSRSSGTAGRWGGDEFLLIAPVNDADQALALADRGRQLVTNSWIRRDGRRVNVSLTVGVALAQRDEPAYDLVNRARKAMTEEKKAGRARTRAGRSGAQAHGWR